jgi:hypothetical protein
LTCNREAVNDSQSCIYDWLSRLQVLNSGLLYTLPERQTFRNSRFTSGLCSVLYASKHLVNITMPRLESDMERHRRPSGQAIILLQIDWLSGNFLHVECPQHARDGEPDLTFRYDHARTDAAPVNIAAYVSQMFSRINTHREN